MQDCCRCIFFIKQKKAYEMRISDWSSDVCSSDLFADYDLTDNIEAFGEFLYTFRKSNQIATPGTLRNLSIAASNPTNPTGQNIVLIQRRLAEPGARQFFQETDTWQGTFGLRGKLSNDWGWEEIGRAHV